MIQRESMRGVVRGSMVEESETEASSREDGVPEESSEPQVQPEPEPESEPEEDEDLEIVENDPANIFLYNPFQLTTSRRKRIQV